MNPRTVRQIRHDLRGSLHQLYFTVELLNLIEDPRELAETAGDIVAGAEATIRLLDELESLQDSSFAGVLPVGLIATSRGPDEAGAERSDFIQ